MTRTIEPSDRDYPEGMSLVSATASWARPPPPLYVRGELPRAPGVAIVGRREASAEAMKFARELAAAVAAEGWAVWSGGALGIDGAAHQGALDAGGCTVAVLTGCFDAPHPPEHGPLFARIVAAGGALVSLQPAGSARSNLQFLRRNLVIAALSRATVVVEAGVLRSGALAMARGALRMGRPTLAVPHAPWCAVGSGCAALLREGAYPIASLDDAIGSLREIVLFGRAPPLVARRARAPCRDDGSEHTEPRAQALDEDERRVLAALGVDGRHLDQVCGATSLPAPRVNRALLTLTLQGLALREGQGLFRRLP